MMANGVFTVTFRGVRGTVPVSQPNFVRYGGHTSCLEVRCGNRLIILDAGTGIRQIAQEDAKVEADILLSHTHIDHIIGLPFFTPLFQPEARLRVWAGHLLPQMHLQEAISRLMSPPLFPLTVADIKANIEWKDFKAGETLASDSFTAHGIAVRTIPLPHPGGATGYRICYKGRDVCYLTDLEHKLGVIDPALADFVQDSDLLIYDSTYDDREFKEYRGWGHSTWQQAVRLADAAGVKKLAIFHHDHMSDDAVLDARAKELHHMRPASVVACEGLTISF